jgi:sodium-dependent dicarboxylate transporter 2/3/5
MELLDFNTIVTLLVLAWIIIGFMSGKWSMGAVAMTGLVVLEITKVLSFDEAFAYFSKNNIVMICGMFILSGALSKTSLVDKLRVWLLKHATNSTTMVALYFGACFIMVSFVSPLALISLLLPMMSALDARSRVQPSNLLYPGSVIAHASQSALPIGNTLAAFVTVNAMLEANGSHTTIGVFDKCLVVFPAALATYLYFVFFGWKKFHSTTIDESQIKEYKEKKSTISPAQEKLIYGVFIAAMLLIVVTNMVKNCPLEMYMVPIIADIILLLAHTINVKDVRDSMNIDSLFMLGGVLPLATAMQNSNAATLVAKSIENALGGHPTFPVFLIAFMLVGGILTQFMSNTATYNVFCPLAIVSAVNMGFNPGAVVLAINAMTTAAMLTPMSSPSVAIAYGAGGYKQGEVFKACIPAWIIHTAVIFITVIILYGSTGQGGLLS